MPTPTKHKFLHVVGKWSRCSAHNSYNQMIVKRKGVCTWLFTMKKSVMQEMRPTKYNVVLQIHPCCCWKQGYIVWLQVNSVALVSCVCFFFFIANSNVCTPFLFIIIWLQPDHMRYTSIYLLLVGTHVWQGLAQLVL